MADQTPQHEQGDAGGRSALPVHKVDVVVSALIIAICGVLFWETVTFAEIPRGLAQNVPPTLFPRLLLVVIAFMALFLPFEYLQKRRMGIDLDDKRRDRIRPITYVTALALFGVTLMTPWLGTFPTMIAACALLPIMWGERRLWLIAIYAIALPLAVTFLFVAGLEVNFMPGIVGHLFR